MNETDEERLKKLEKHQASHCDECGAELPSSDWTGSGYGKCSDCEAKKRRRTTLTAKKVSF